MRLTTSHLDLAQQLADHFQLYNQVEAVALGGSLTSGASADPASDIDLYVFVTAPVPLAERLAIVDALGGASKANMDLNLWDPGDEWFDARTGIEIDVMYWDPRWMEDSLDRVIRQHQASMGYSTAHWHTIRHARALFDRSGWFAGLQKLSALPYPEPLCQNIIAKNLPVLRDLIPSYLHQVEKAARRGDLVSVNHRAAGFFASYFDVIFAANRVLHPGEKRLLDQVKRLCSYVPANMEQQVNEALRLAGSTDLRLVEALNRLVDGLEAMLQAVKADAA